MTFSCYTWIHDKKIFNCNYYLTIINLILNRLLIANISSEHLAGNNISSPCEFMGNVSCTPARHRSSLSVLTVPASLALHLLRRLQALKTTPTAVPLTATATVLQAARAGTHHPDPQHEAVTFQRHLPPTRPALRKHRQITHGTLLFIFFPPFPKIKLGVSCSGCTSCILRSLSSGPSLQDL